MSLTSILQESTGGAAGSQPGGSSPTLDRPEPETVKQRGLSLPVKEWRGRSQDQGGFSPPVDGCRGWGQDQQDPGLERVDIQDLETPRIEGLSPTVKNFRARGQHQQGLGVRLRQAGLTPPSLLKRSASLAKLDHLQLSTFDLSDLDAGPGEGFEGTEMGMG